MYIEYKPVLAESYIKYYQNQAGYGDNPPLQTYKGSAYQRGYGIGSIFSNLIRGITPLFKSTFGRQAASKLVNAGLNISNDLLEGKNFNESAKLRFKETGAALLDDAVSALRNNQSGSGFKRKRKRSNNKGINKRRKLTLKKKKKSKTKHRNKRKNKNKNRRVKKDIFNI